MIFELILNLGFIVIAVLSFYFLSLGKKYESDMDKDVLNLFSLGLFFVVVKSVATVAVLLGVNTLLMSSTAIVIYNYLIAGCFLIGIVFLKKVDVVTGE